jgi:hypothetical protein
MWVTGRACGAAASVPTRAAVHTRHALLHASDPVTDGWTDLLGILAARAWQWQGAQPHQAAMIEERIPGSSPARAPDGLVPGHACARAGRQVVDGSQHHRWTFATKKAYIRTSLVGLFMWQLLHWLPAPLGK